MPCRARPARGGGGHHTGPRPGYGRATAGPRPAHRAPVARRPLRRARGTARAPPSSQLPPGLAWRPPPSESPRRGPRPPAPRPRRRGGNIPSAAWRWRRRRPPVPQLSPSGRAVVAEQHLLLLVRHGQACAGQGGTARATRTPAAEGSRAQPRASPIFRLSSSRRSLGGIRWPRRAATVPYRHTVMPRRPWSATAVPPRSRCRCHVARRAAPAKYRVVWSQRATARSCRTCAEAGSGGRVADGQRAPVRRPARPIRAALRRALSRDAAARHWARQSPPSPPSPHWDIATASICVDMRRCMRPWPRPWPRRWPRRRRVRSGIWPAASLPDPVAVGDTTTPRGRPAPAAPFRSTPALPSWAWRARPLARPRDWRLATRDSRLATLDSRRAER